MNYFIPWAASQSMCVFKCFRLYSLVLVVSCVRLKLFYSFAKNKEAVSEWSYSPSVAQFFICCADNVYFLSSHECSFHRLILFLLLLCCVFKQAVIYCTAGGVIYNKYILPNFSYPQISHPLFFHLFPPQPYILHSCYSGVNAFSVVVYQHYSSRHFE